MFAVREQLGLQELIWLFFKASSMNVKLFKSCISLIKAFSQSIVQGGPGGGKWGGLGGIFNT